MISGEGFHHRVHRDSNKHSLCALWWSTSSSTEGPSPSPIRTDSLCRSSGRCFVFYLLAVKPQTKFARYGLGGLLLFTATMTVMGMWFAETPPSTA